MLTRSSAKVKARKRCFKGWCFDCIHLSPADEVGCTGVPIERLNMIIYLLSNAANISTDPLGIGVGLVNRTVGGQVTLRSANLNAAEPDQLTLSWYREFGPSEVVNWPALSK
jgi:hypothetical protein